jgi:hypothetical protein
MSFGSGSAGLLFVLPGALLHGQWVLLLLVFLGDVEVVLVGDVAPLAFDGIQCIDHGDDLGADVHFFFCREPQVRGAFADIGGNDP